MKLLLASQSPRRQALLANFGVEFDVLSTDIDESRLSGESPAEYVYRLSREKAAAAWQLRPDFAGIIVTADTIVADGDSVLGKPVDAEEARQTLESLRGRTHEVMTAFTVLNVVDEQMLTEVVHSPVLMRLYEAAEIDAYIDSGDPFDKAGAYAIQNTDFKPVARFEHCVPNVMGLPLCQLSHALQKAGANITTGRTANCVFAPDRADCAWREVYLP